MRVSPPKNKKLVNTGVSFIGVRPLKSSILVFLIQVLVFYLILGESFEIHRNPILGSILFKDYFHGF